MKEEKVWRAISWALKVFALPILLYALVAITCGEINLVNWSKMAQLDYALFVVFTWILQAILD
jgi:hypothetical protein